MLMVIFGAGASYDSVSHLPNGRPAALTYRPPLAKDLFARRSNFDEWIQKFPRCNAVIPLLRQAAETGSVESELERLKEKAVAYPNLQKALSAVRFYLQSMLWECEAKWKEEVAKGVTNYKTLLHLIDIWRTETKEKVCLVTFNYDRMLEDALSEVDLKIRDLTDYIADENYKIIKLHGSVNWVHPVNIEIKDLASRSHLEIANELIDRNDELEILSLDFRMVGVYPYSKTKDWPVFPALAIPVEAKQNYECPKTHLETLYASIPEVTKILLIGWRATEKVFVQSLKENLCGRVQMTAVNGSERSSKESMGRLVQEGIQGTLHSTTSGFSDFVTSREVDGFLRLA
jgi:hypothetical protein